MSKTRIKHPVMKITGHRVSDKEDRTDTMYPPGHNLEPVKYMKIITIPKHPQALERYFTYKAKRKNESNKSIHQ